jgi:hypothetical protein
MWVLQVETNKSILKANMKGASKLQLKLTTLKEEPKKEQQTMYAQKYQGNKKNTKI